MTQSNVFLKLLFTSLYDINSVKYVKKKKSHESYL